MPAAENEKTVRVGMTEDALADTIAQAIGAGDAGAESPLSVLPSIDDNVAAILSELVDGFRSMGGSVMPGGMTGGLAVAVDAAPADPAREEFYANVVEALRSLPEQLRADPAAPVGARPEQVEERPQTEGSQEKAEEAEANAEVAKASATEASEAAGEAADAAEGMSQAVKSALSRMKNAYNKVKNDLDDFMVDQADAQFRLENARDEAERAQAQRDIERLEADRLDAVAREAQLDAVRARLVGDEDEIAAADERFRRATAAAGEAQEAYAARYPEQQGQRGRGLSDVIGDTFGGRDGFDLARSLRDFEQGNYGDFVSQLGALVGSEGGGGIAGLLGRLTGGSGAAGSVVGALGRVAGSLAGVGTGIGAVTAVASAFGNFMNYWDESARTAARYGTEGNPYAMFARAQIGAQRNWTAYTTGLTADQARQIQTSLMEGGADFGTEEYDEGYDFSVAAYRNTGTSVERATSMYVQQVLRGARTTGELMDSLEAMDEAVQNSTWSMTELEQQYDQAAKTFSQVAGGDEAMGFSVADLLLGQEGLANVGEGTMGFASGLAGGIDYNNVQYQQRYSEYRQQGMSDEQAMMAAVWETAGAGQIYENRSEGMLWREYFLVSLPGTSLSLYEMMNYAYDHPESKEAVREEMVAVLTTLNESPRDYRNWAQFVSILVTMFKAEQRNIESPKTVADYLLGMGSAMGNIEAGISQSDVQALMDSATGDEARSVYANTYGGITGGSLARDTAVGGSVFVDADASLLGFTDAEAASGTVDVFEDRQRFAYNTAVALTYGDNPVLSEEETRALDSDLGAFYGVSDAVWAAYTSEMEELRKNGQEDSVVTYAEWLKNPNNRDTIYAAAHAGQNGELTGYGSFDESMLDDEYSRLHEAGALTDEQEQALAQNGVGEGGDEEEAPENALETVAQFIVDNPLSVETHANLAVSDYGNAYDELSSDEQSEAWRQVTQMEGFDELTNEQQLALGTHLNDLYNIWAQGINLNISLGFDPNSPEVITYMVNKSNLAAAMDAGED